MATSIPQRLVHGRRFTGHESASCMVRRTPSTGVLMVPARDKLDWCRDMSDIGEQMCPYLPVEMMRHTMRRRKAPFSLLWLHVPSIGIQSTDTYLEGEDRDETGGTVNECTIPSITHRHATALNVHDIHSRQV